MTPFRAPAPALPRAQVAHARRADPLPAVHRRIVFNAQGLEHEHEHEHEQASQTNRFARLAVSSGHRINRKRLSFRAPARPRARVAHAQRADPLPAVHRRLVFNAQGLEHEHEQASQTNRFVRTALSSGHRINRKRLSFRAPARPRARVAHAPRADPLPAVHRRLVFNAQGLEHEHEQASQTNRFVRIALSSGHRINRKRLSFRAPAPARVERCPNRQSLAGPRTVPRCSYELHQRTLTLDSRSNASQRSRGCSSMVERQLPKLHTRVRFPSPAPIKFQT